MSLDTAIRVVSLRTELRRFNDDTSTLVARAREVRSWLVAKKFPVELWPAEAAKLAGHFDALLEYVGTIDGIARDVKVRAYLLARQYDSRLNGARRLIGFVVVRELDVSLVARERERHDREWQEELERNKVAREQAKSA